MVKGAFGFVSKFRCKEQGLSHTAQGQQRCRGAPLHYSLKVHDMRWHRLLTPDTAEMLTRQHTAAAGPEHNTKHFPNASVPFILYASLPRMNQHDVLSFTESNQTPESLHILYVDQSHYVIGGSVFMACITGSRMHWMLLTVNSTPVLVLFWRTR